MGRRQLVITRSDPAAKPRGGDAPPMVPLGTADEVIRAFGKFNTAPDGGPPARSGSQVLYGPGMVVDVPTFGKEVTQAMVSVSDDEIAVPVLLLLCRANGWRMVDLESGRGFG
jgi:hypothetical protein